MHTEMIFVRDFHQLLNGFSSLWAVFFRAEGSKKKKIKFERKASLY